MKPCAEFSFFNPVQSKTKTFPARIVFDSGPHFDYSILIISILSPYIRSCNQNQNLFMLQEFCRHFKVLLGHFMFMLVSILLSIKAELVLASTSFAILFVLFTSSFVLLILNWQNLQNSQSKSSLI